MLRAVGEAREYRTPRFSSRGISKDISLSTIAI